MLRDAESFRELRQRCGLIDAVLGHVAVGRPFAAADGDQAGAVDLDDMIARQRRGPGHAAADAPVVPVVVLDAVPAAVPTSGRMPANTLSTSSRVGAFARYSPAVARMNSISCSWATGSSVADAMGVSVVPTSVCPCHGIANNTRPSLVCGP